MTWIEDVRANERFDAKWNLEPDTGCHLWSAHTDHRGYGVFTVSHHQAAKAHRYAYEHQVGPVPDGLELDHLCRNRACVNPGHLEPVTHRENVLRGESFSARNAQKTYCKNGHEFTDGNTYVYSGEVRSFRDCRECRRDATRRYRAKLSRQEQK